jgi:hypothetical protein
VNIASTGKQVEVPFMFIYIVEDEKLVDHHIVKNERAMLQQLDVLPTPESAYGNTMMDNQAVMKP